MVAAVLFVLFGFHFNKQKKENFDTWSEGELRCIAHGTNCPNVGWMN